MKPRCYTPHHRFPQSLRIAALCACVTLATLSSGQAASPLVTLRTGTAALAIDAKGEVCALSRQGDNRSYLAPNQPAPLLSLRIQGKFHPPEGADWDPQSKRLTLHFRDSEVIAIVAAEAKPTHVVFELLKLQPSNAVELVLWGPYPTTIRDIVGEVVGVVRDAEFAVGLQSLNAKTLGGYPAKENDIETEYTADDPGH